VTAPLIEGDTSISGTSTSPDGTVIRVCVDGVYIGQTTVLGGTWTLGSIGPLVAGEEVTATAQETGKSVSNLSAPVVVAPLGQVTPAPAINPAYEGDPTITGTSPSPDGTLIDVFVDGVYVGQTTVSGGAWSLGPVAPLVAGQVLTAQATEPGKGTSALSAPVTVLPRPAILKRSSANGGGVSPGQTLTYTIEVANNTASTWSTIVVEDPVPAGTTSVAGSTQVTYPADVTYYDQFSGIAYDGTNGTVNWQPNPWVEIGDNGDVTSGDVLVVSDAGFSNALRVDDNDNGARRPANLSGWASGSVSFTYRRTSSFTGSESVRLQISNDNGTSFPTTLATINGSGSNDSAYLTSGPHTIPSAYLVSGFQLRFITSGNMEEGDNVFLDDVRVYRRSTTIAPGCDPPTLVGTTGCDGHTLQPGETMTITFQVTVDDCISGDIENTATLTANGSAIGSSTVTDSAGSSDQDGDGIPDSQDGCGDSDGDGFPNYLDLDSDNDGILDSVEQRIDTDGDGVYDFLDLDTDNDGINDLVESGLNFTELALLDANGDGRIDATNAFGTNGLADMIETVPDSGDPDYDNDLAGPDAVANTDGSGPADWRDLDSDNDGLNDVIEGGEADADGNGILDGAPDPVTGQIPGADNAVPDTDGTGLPDYRDLDSDGDGTSDITESGQGYLDGDSDGDIDSPADADGDGIPDVADGAEGTFGDAPDTDNDGIPDATDIDDDNDGILDTVEGPPGTDTDGDGVPDSLDLDTDNDGINDLVESGLNSTELAALDANGDGRIDHTVPVGSNGLANAIETSPDSGNPDYDDDGSGPDAVANTDGTGPADFRDLDSDNDGLNDVIEGGEADADGNGLIDGTPNATTGQIPGADNAVPNTDGTGLPDYRDLDSDGDGTWDIDEIGLGGLDGDDDGDIDSTTDGDGDGIPDVADGLPGAFGDAQDWDGDGIPDATDIDDDNDGILDVVEGPPGTDTDSDGVPDAFDLDSDNDGINDLVESGLNFTELALLDTNGDGRIDGTAAFGTNGLADMIETAPDSGLPDYDDNGAGPDAVANSDGTGPPDFRDLDSDNDGVNDVLEGGGTDADEDGLADGTPNPLTGQVPGADNAVPNTDGTGLPDYRDLDSDDDGIPDIEEACKDALDADDDGDVDDPTDADNDGIPDVLDGDPTWGDLPGARPNLLRNDDTTSIATYSPLAIFTKSYPLPPGETSLQGRGTNDNPEELEAGMLSVPGSGDDDDHYLRKVVSPLTDAADAAILADDGRPLVFYELTCSSCTIYLQKTAGGRIQITW
jgi:uncharacterized repeat protein (TIGR01451 family)